MPRRRPTTNHELTRLTVMAGAGVSKAEAARVIGCSQAMISYWARKVGLRFADGGQPLMQRLIEHRRS